MIVGNPGEGVNEAAPLAATLQRGRMRTHRGCHFGAHVRAAPSEGAVTLDALVGDPARLADVLSRIGDDVGSPRADVQASLLLEAYAWTLLLPLLGAVVVERRVPVLEPGSTAVVLRDGLWPDELVLSGTRFVGLPGDPNAGHLDAVAVADEDALAATLRDQVIEHLHHPIGVLASHGRRPQRALWRSVADRLAAAALFAAETVGYVQRGARVASAVLSGPLPLVGRPDYRMIVTSGGPMRVHARQGCCLWWRTRAASYCLSCPLNSAPSADGT